MLYDISGQPTQTRTRTRTRLGSAGLGSTQHDRAASGITSEPASPRVPAQAQASALSTAALAHLRLRVTARHVARRTARAVAAGVCTGGWMDGRAGVHVSLHQSVGQSARARMPCAHPTSRGNGTTRRARAPGGDGGGDRARRGLPLLVTCWRRRCDRFTAGVVGGWGDAGNCTAGVCERRKEGRAAPLCGAVSACGWVSVGSGWGGCGQGERMDADVAGGAVDAEGEYGTAGASGAAPPRVAEESVRGPRCTRCDAAKVRAKRHQ